MNHPSDEALSARLDAALAEGEQARLDAHLAGCAPCRDRLAALAALDAGLAASLRHEPGDAYFAAFADRVAARIAAPPPPAARDWGATLRAWCTTPRGLATVGGTMVLVAVSTLAWNTARQQAADGPRALAPAPLATTAPRTADATPEAPPEAAVPRATGSAAPTRGDAAAPARPPAEARREDAGPGRMQELRTLDNGEQVPAAPRIPVPAPVREETAADAAPSITALKRQQVAQPLVPTRAPSAPEPPAPAARDAATQADAGPAASLSREALAPAPAAPGASRKSLLPGAERAKALALPVPAATGGVARCGVVRDPQGRPLAHVAVTFVGRARVARTDAEGRFCLEMPASGGQLALDAVGFESRRLTLGPAVPGEDLVLALDPVPVLGVAPLARDGRGGAARAGDEDAVRAAPGATGAELALPAPDLRLEPDTVRVLFQRARTLRREVGARPTAGQWEAIAAVWDAAGDHADDREVVARARYEGLAARMRAWRLDPSPARHRLAAAAVATLEAAAPTGPLRTAAERWGRELRP